MALRWVKLFIAVGVVAAVWLIFLPRAAKAPATADRLIWLEEKGIDPSAMYYTELEMMTPTFERLAMDQRVVLPENRIK